MHKEKKRLFIQNFDALIDLCAGHRKVVEMLIAAGADPTLKMGDLTAADIAKDFNHQDLLSLLRS